MRHEEMARSTPTRPRVSPEDAGIFLGLFLLAVARGLTAVARRLGGAQIASRVESQRGAPEYGFYSAASLEESLHRFETHFGLSSAEFVDLYSRNELPDRVPRHAANVWAGLDEELSRLRAQG